MKVKVLIHPDETGGFWAEVPAVPGCVSEGDTLEQVKKNIAEALEGMLLIETPATETEPGYQVGEIEV
ncbi:MAG TPA: type II toxin-antitoxin system HicB family antitoxin [Gemmataceae bacterium]|jgi:predicted RNase H-like HicB family nuclease|nr:type II toxin-antitoxin system HicB family antitoxin [Gemmataceae bacterium]